MKNQSALVVKLVDTTDLKSVPFWSASSSLAEGTTEIFYITNILLSISIVIKLTIPTVDAEMKPTTNGL
jgi:hypothetical protein